MFLSHHTQHNLKYIFHTYIITSNNLIYNFDIFQLISKFNKNHYTERNYLILNSIHLCNKNIHRFYILSSSIVNILHNMQMIFNFSLPIKNIHLHNHHTLELNLNYIIRFYKTRLVYHKLLFFHSKSNQHHILDI
jgi:hypothetical protein